MPDFKLASSCFKQGYVTPAKIASEFWLAPRTAKWFSINARFSQSILLDSSNLYIMNRCLNGDIKRQYMTSFQCQNNTKGSKFFFIWGSHAVYFHLQHQLMNNLCYQLHWRLMIHKIIGHCRVFYSDGRISLFLRNHFRGVLYSLIMVVNIYDHLSFLLSNLVKPRETKSWW